MSDDTFSFDNAVPAETMDTSLNESNESSAMQSSPDGSFSQWLVQIVPNHQRD